MLKLKFIIALLIIAVFSLPATGFALKKGDPFPPLSGTTLQGEPFDFTSLKGQPILLKLGTTWCPTCTQQSEIIDQLHNFITENKIKFVEVFIQETPRTVLKNFSKTGHHSPDVIIMDKGEIASKLNIYLIPRIVMIDKNFNIYRDGEPIAKEALKQELLKLIAQE